MINVKNAVKSVLLSSETATEAFFQGYLNFSAYAKQIRPQVEAATRKEVTVGNIVVSLSRLSREEKGRLRKKNHEFIPPIVLNDLSVKSPLTEITFDNTAEIRSKLQSIKHPPAGAHDFYYVAQGISEITIITSPETREKTLKIIAPLTPKMTLSGLAAVTVRFDPKYLDIPNAIYAILRILALDFINVVEIVSTYTEISLIVEQGEMMKTFALLNRHLKK